MQLLDGKKISSDIKDEIAKEVESLSFKPGLAVILVGNDPASHTYVKNKEIACEKVGFYHKTYRLDEKATEKELLELIDKINRDIKIHGLIVQLPLPKHISEDKVLNTISIEKDVDCFHPFNVGKILTWKKGDEKLKILPCTPAGVIEILDRYNINVSGKNVAVVGRSNIVGKPLSIMLLARDATVTMCHSRTKNLEEVLKNSDIVFAAVGIAKMIKSNMIKEGAVAIDIGVNRENGKLCGDMDFEDIKNKVSAITPVPGGIGPMTIAMLLKNTLEIAKSFRDSK